MSELGSITSRCSGKWVHAHPQRHEDRTRESGAADAASSPGVAPCLSAVCVELWDWFKRARGVVGLMQARRRTIKPRAPCFPARNGAWGRGRERRKSSLSELHQKEIKITFTAWRETINRSQKNYHGARGILLLDHPLFSRVELFFEGFKGCHVIRILQPLIAHTFQHTLVNVFDFSCVLSVSCCLDSHGIRRHTRCCFNCLIEFVKPWGLGKDLVIPHCEIPAEIRK